MGGWFISRNREKSLYFNVLILWWIPSLWRLRRASRGLPVGDLGNLGDSGFVQRSIFISQPKFRRMFPQPLFECLFRMFAAGVFNGQPCANRRR